MRSNYATQLFAYGKLTHKVYLLLVFIIYLLICLFHYNLYLLQQKWPCWRPSGRPGVSRDSLQPATFHVSGRVNRHNVRIRGSENPIVLARPEPVFLITLTFTVNFLYHSSVVYLLESFGILRLKVVSSEPSLTEPSPGVLALSVVL